MIPQAPKDWSGPTDLARPGLYESPNKTPHTTLDVIVNTDLHRTHSQQSCTILSWLVRRITFNAARLTQLHAAQYPLGPRTNQSPLFHTPSLCFPHSLSRTSTLGTTNATLIQLLTESLRAYNMTHMPSTHLSRQQAETSTQHGFIPATCFTRSRMHQQVLSQIHTRNSATRSSPSTPTSGARKLQIAPTHQ